MSKTPKIVFPGSKETMSTMQHSDSTRRPPQNLPVSIIVTNKLYHTLAGAPSDLEHFT